MVMTGSPDYRLYLQEKFESVEQLMTLQFTEIHRRLGAIEDQVRKTNGTVTEHEKFKQYAQQIIDTRSTDCPHVDNIDKIDKDLKKIEEDLSEYRMLKKYPKLGVLIIAIFVVGMYLGYRKIVNTQMLIRNEMGVQMMYPELRTRGGVILIDSLQNNSQHENQTILPKDN